MDIQSLLATSGGAFIIGVFTGFAARRLINVFAFVVGIQVAFFTYLEYINLVTINWDFIERIISIFQEIFTTLRFPETVSSDELLNASGAVGGFAIGLFIGYFYA
jgi:uncharacterized membrane protein (Fun14 family)